MNTNASIKITELVNSFSGICHVSRERVESKQGFLALKPALGAADHYMWTVISAKVKRDLEQAGQSAVSAVDLARVQILGRSAAQHTGRTARGRHGRTLGLAVTETWHRVFAQNEQIKSNGGKPSTDEQISEFMKAEFPDQPAKSKSVGRVRMYRTCYNNGTHGFEQWGKPAKPSVEYDAQGNPAAPGSDRQEIAVAPQAPAEVDWNRVRAIAKEEAKLASAAALPPQISITWSGRDKVTVDTAGKNAAFAEVLKRVAAGLNVLLVGPTGCGKSHLVKQVAEALKLPFTMNSMSEGVSESALLGRVIPDSKGAWHYQEPPFVKSYRDGGVHLLDEIDAADPNMLIQVNAALANGVLSIPQCQVAPIKRHKDSVVIAAANTFGKGADREYVGRNQLDEATLDRFRMGTIEVDYDAKLEEAIACAIIGDGELAKGMLRFFWQTRERARAHRLRRPVSTRVIEDSAKLVKSGSNLADVKQIFFQSWNDDEKIKVGGAIL